MSGRRLFIKDPDAEPVFGKPPDMRSVEDLLDFGVVVVDKPMGPTSHQVSAWVRDILHARRTGHAGTLDPRVTGVLPVGINRATKIINYVHREPKEYVAVMRLHGDVEEDRIRRVMGEFVGLIYQVPPVRSAVARRLRKRRVYEMEILEIEGRDVLFRVRVESGTYIRTLCVDIGEALCVGAHMADLRRTATGVFNEEHACTLQDLLDAYVFWVEDGDEREIRRCIYPPEFMFSTFPRIYVKDSAVDAIAHGAPVYASGVARLTEGIEKGTLVAVFTLSGELVGLGRATLSTEEILRATSGVVCTMERVTMEPGRYPPLWKRDVQKG